MSRKPKWAPLDKELCAHYALGALYRYEDGRCRECARERATAWNRANSEIANARRRAWDTENPEKSKEAKASWKDENPTKVRAQGRKDHHKRQGIVFALGQSVETLLVAQNGRCANQKCNVLFSDLPPQHLHVDHDHNVADGSPNVRGLLCLRCNTGAGKLGDSPEKLRGLADYIENGLSKTLLLFQ